jgi:hypothetical protein
VKRHSVTVSSRRQRSRRGPRRLVGCDGAGPLNGLAGGDSRRDRRHLSPGGQAGATAHTTAEMPRRRVWLWRLLITAYLLLSGLGTCLAAQVLGWAAVLCVGWVGGSVLVLLSWLAIVDARHYDEEWRARYERG